MTSDNYAVRHYVDREMWPVTRLIRDVVGGRAMRDYYGWRKRTAASKFEKSCSADVALFLGALRQVVATSTLPERIGMYHSILEKATFVSRSYQTGQRILVDEGIGARLLRLVARSGGKQADGELLKHVYQCFECYPWDKNALFIDAPPEVCEQRQIARGHVIFGPAKPQVLNHVAADMLAKMCLDTGWRVVRLDNQANDDRSSVVWSHPSADARSKPVRPLRPD